MHPRWFLVCVNTGSMILVFCCPESLCACGLRTLSVHQTQSKKFQLLCAVLEISWPEGSKILNRKQFKADNYEYHMQRIAPTCALIVNCVLKKYQLGCIDNQFCAEKVPTLTPCLSGADSELAKYQAQWIDHYSALCCLLA